MSNRCGIAVLGAAVALVAACTRDRSEPIVTPSAVELSETSQARVAQIQALLRDDPTLSPAARNVTFSVDPGGVVTLLGEVATDQERLAIERHAVVVFGTDRVRNQLALVVTPQPGDDELTAPGTLPVPGTTGGGTPTRDLEPDTGMIAPSGTSGNVPGTTAPSPSSPGTTTPTPSPGTTPAAPRQ